jgi:hypothetical protein
VGQPYELKLEDVVDFKSWLEDIQDGPQGPQAASARG